MTAMAVRIRVAAIMVHILHERSRSTYATVTLRRTTIIVEEAKIRRIEGGKPEGRPRWTRTDSFVSSFLRIFDIAVGACSGTASAVDMPTSHGLHSRAAASER